MPESRWPARNSAPATGFPDEDRYQAQAGDCSCATFTTIEQA